MKEEEGTFKGSSSRVVQKREKDEGLIKGRKTMRYIKGAQA